MPMIIPIYNIIELQQTVINFLQDASQKIASQTVNRRRSKLQQQLDAAYIAGYSEGLNQAQKTIATWQIKEVTPSHTSDTTH